MIAATQHDAQGRDEGLEGIVKRTPEIDARLSPDAPLEVRRHFDESQPTIVRCDARLDTGEAHGIVICKKPDRPFVPCPESRGDVRKLLSYDGRG